MNPLSLKSGGRLSVVYARAGIHSLQVRNKITWMDLDNFGKAEALEKFKVKTTKKEMVVYSILGINILIPCTAWPVTNPLIWKISLKLGVVR